MMPDTLRKLEALDTHLMRYGLSVADVIEHYARQMHGLPPMPAEERDTTPDMPAPASQTAPEASNRPATTKGS